jgi:hypothetical protein
VISKGILDLANHHTGYPNGLTNLKWTKILRTISKGFDIVNKVDNQVTNKNKSIFKYEVEIKKAFKQEKEAFKLLSRYFNDLWD